MIRISAPSRTPRHRARAALLVALLVTGGACADGGDDERGDDTASAPTDAETGPITAGGALPELTPVRVTTLGGRPAFVDGTGREVLLRGASFNALGDYHQADPAFPPTRPPTDDDWDEMAAAGFSVVRLVVSWSALEPVRGQIDVGYVERIRQAVDAAAARRIYTVVDMHQDAWGKFIATPPGTVCPPGTEPAIGWDGAPQWATITDGADTCRPVGDRDGAPAVRAAFTAFYENRDGIRDAFAATWHRLVAALGPTPAIAGYDLLNEPNLVLEPVASEQRYTELLRSTVAEVRAGEAEAGIERRVVFVEPMAAYPQPGSLPTQPLALDDQMAFAPHSDAEVVGPTILTVEQTWELSAATAAERGWPLWIGEHGVHAVDEAARAVDRRFAAAQDAALAGGARWQWRQWCGDPHAIGVPGRAVTEVQVQLNEVTCPADASTGPNEDLMRVAARAYPRAAPGRLTKLRSDPDAGTLSVEGAIEDDLASGGDLVVWVPGEDRPELDGRGLGEPVVRQVPGGWYATVEVIDSPYELTAR